MESATAIEPGRAGDAEHVLFFALRPAEGEPLKGQLEALERPWRIKLGGRTWQGADVLELRSLDQPVRLAPQGPQVLLANGDRIAMKVHQADGELLGGSSGPLGELLIPLERIRAVLLNPPADELACDRLCRHLANERTKSDRVILANGDVVRGTLMKLTAEQVVLQSDGDGLGVPRESVKAIAFSWDLTFFPPLKSLYAQAALADGTVLSLTEAELTGQILRCRAAFGDRVFVPLSQLCALAFRNGRVTYLSDLQPASYRHRPFFSLEFPYRRDRNVMGGPLRIRGQLFRKGLGQHSGSELTYRLDGPWRRFEATVGIDDSAHGGGSALFIVKLDGRVVWRSDELTGRSGTQEARVELGKAKELTLAVDYGRNAHVLDRADWAEARLIK